MTTPQVNLFYPSVADAIANARSSYVRIENQRLVNGYLNNDSRRQEWYGFNGNALEVIASFHDGNPKAERKVHDFHSDITASLPRAIGVNRTLVRGSLGDDLDIHAVNRGGLDRAWSSRQRRVKQGPSILRLCVDICANAGADGDSLAMRGVAGLALASVMVKAGYSVEIIATLAVSRFVSGHNMTASTVIKPRHAQVDLGLLAATIATAGFFRTIGFCQIVRAADDLDADCYDGLGSALDAEKLLPVPDRVTQLFVPNAIHDQVTAKKWVGETVRLLQGV